MDSSRKIHMSKRVELRVQVIEGSRLRGGSRECEANPGIIDHIAGQRMVIGLEWMHTQ